MKTELKDRTLWYDGTNQVDPDIVPQLILNGVPIEKIVVNSLNEDLKTFNTLEDVSFPLNKSENCKFDLSWNIPEKFKNVNLLDYVVERLDKIPVNIRQKYHDRLVLEIEEIEKRDVSNLFKMLVYVTETLKNSKTVFGVGRGSSCACLFLYLIGLHKVDPIKYDIPLSEFFH